MSRSSVEKGAYICDVCGKLHYRYPGYIYKIVYEHKTRHFCSYACYTKINTLLEEHKYDEVSTILNSHDSNSTINEV